METFKRSYQIICEVLLEHEFLPTNARLDDWFECEIDTKNKQMLSDNQLNVKYFEKGLRLITLTKAPNEPMVAIDGVVFNLGFQLKNSVAGNTKLDAHFIVNNKEGRYVFGNKHAIEADFPSLERAKLIEAPTDENKRLFGYLELIISKGNSGFDMLDNNNKIKFQNGSNTSKYKLLFKKK